MARTITPAVDTQVAILAAKGIPKAQIAKTLKIGRQRVTHALQRQAETIEAAEAKLREYQTQITEVLPGSHRASRLKDMVDQTKNPMATLRAIEHIDHIMGYLGRERGDATSAPAVPMFELPPGSQVGVLIKPPPDEK